MKDQMSLLAVELQSDTTAEELLSLSLAVSAKNNMHNIRGYSPNQWAFGQNHSRIASFLQQYRNLPLQSSHEDDSFENQLQKGHEAQKLFLKVDASRRMSTALNHRCRPLREFVTGDLVHYFRRDRKDSGNSKYGGRWHGPARVLAHEKTSDFCDGQHAGSVVWIFLAGVLFRCSPEQLRFVNHDI